VFLLSKHDIILIVEKVPSHCTRVKCRVTASPAREPHEVRNTSNKLK